MSGQGDSAAFSRLVGTVLAGRYEITGVLGAGGMGVVLEARQVAMDRRVAVKVLHPSFGANRHAVARFVREMQVTSRLEHASTVRVYDFGEATDADGVHLFLVMELLQGRTLGKVLAEGGLTQARAVAIAAQIARALEAAHGEGIVHRDLKPDNVMLVDRYGQADVVKVLDFGIARFVDGAEGDGVGKLTAEGAVVGTPAYMSPEQATGAELGAASDIYSLGVMLFEMATGRVPFIGPTTVSLMVKHVQETPPRPSELAAIDPRLEALILACLEKQPERRPASAKTLAEALEALGRALAESEDAAEPPQRVVHRDGQPGMHGESSKSSARRLASEARTARRSERRGDDAPASRGMSGWWLIGAGVVALGLVIGLLASRDSGSTIEAARPVVRTDVEPRTTAEDTLTRGSQARPSVADEPMAPAHCFVEVVAKARAAVRAGAPDALALAQEAVATCPSWAVAQVVLGQAQQAAKAWSEARAAFVRAQELAPMWGLPAFDLALVELSAGEPEAARDTLTRLIDRAPDWRDARLLRAQAELQLRDFVAAREDAEAATVATPEEPSAWFLLAESHRALGAAGSAEIARSSYCKAKALGLAAAAERCDASP